MRFHPLNVDLLFSRMIECCFGIVYFASNFVAPKKVWWEEMGEKKRKLNLPIIASRQSASFALPSWPFQLNSQHRPHPPPTQSASFAPPS